MRTDSLRVQDALAAIGQIERRTPRDRAAFFADELIQVWVLYHLAIVGEALRAMSTEFQSQHPEINWAGWTGLRNIVVHQYFQIQPQRIWDTIDVHLPVLKAQLTMTARGPE